LFPFPSVLSPFFFELVITCVSNQASESRLFTFTGDNMFGPDGFRHTIHQTFDWNEEIGF
jgi:hypothetical protein